MGKLSVAQDVSLAKFWLSWGFPLLLNNVDFDEL